LDRLCVAAFRPGKPTGEKFLLKTPVVVQQSMAAGHNFGQSVAADLRQRMIDELRKKGHDL